MKSKIYIILLSINLFANNAITLNSEEQAYLKNKKTITMCIDPNWMPYEKFDENSKHIGMSADYFNMFREKFNLKIDVIQTKNWAESIQFAKDRKCDIMSLVMQTPERKKYLNFTTPYLKIPLVIATKIDIAFIDNISLIQDKQLAIPKGYAFIEILKTKYPNINIVEVENIEEGLQKVEDGKVFGYIGTLGSISYILQTSFEGNLKITGKFYENWELGIGVRNDDTILLNIFQKAVDSISLENQQDIIYRWISLEHKRYFDYNLFINFIFVVAFIFLILSYRYYLIKKLHKEITIKFKQELKKSQEKDKMLFHQNKLASMGEMLENIAHQWRQPLSIINSSVLNIDAELLRKEIKNSFIEDKLLEIESLTQYMSTTIDDFKNFFDDNKIKTSFYLEDTISKSLYILDGVISFNNINIIIDLHKKHKYFGYENELQQVILIILNNAIDALNAKEITSPTIKIDITNLENSIVISISDNAGGIALENIDKVFEQYFTTKYQKNGTGLGLSISKIIIEKSFNGEISVKNSDVGAIFLIKIEEEITDE